MDVTSPLEFASETKLDTSSEFWINQYPWYPSFIIIIIIIISLLHRTSQGKAIFKGEMSENSLTVCVCVCARVCVRVCVCVCVCVIPK